MHVIYKLLYYSNQEITARHLQWWELF